MVTAILKSGSMGFRGISWDFVVFQHLFKGCFMVSAKGIRRCNIRVWRKRSCWWPSKSTLGGRANGSPDIVNGGSSGVTNLGLSLQTPANIRFSHQENLNITSSTVHSCACEVRCLGEDFIIFPTATVTWRCHMMRLGFLRKMPHKGWSKPGSR